MDTFKIISKPGCPACTRAKQALTVRGFAYEEDLRDTPEGIAAFVEAGFRTFPQVWHGEQHIGGADQLVNDYLPTLEDF